MCIASVSALINSLKKALVVKTVKGVQSVKLQFKNESDIRSVQISNILNLSVSLQQQNEKMLS